MNTKALRQKILDLAIHGKLVPQDPNDEPASVLLERIKAEKERLIIEGKIKRTKRSKAACDKPHYPYELPKGWCWCKLEEIVKITNGRSQKNVEDKEGLYPIYGSGGIIGKATEFLCEAGTTIIGRKGTINNPIFVKERFWNIDTAFGMKPQYAISDKYFFFFCQHFNFSELDKSTAVPSLTQSAINDIFIPIPPTNEQKRIVKEIIRCFSVVEILEKEKIDLQLTIEQTKSKILDLAIHGKLVPQDPTDEPASELLKRINPKAEITCDNPHYRNLPEGWAAAPMQMLCSLVDGEKQSGVERINLDVKFLRGEREAKVLSAGKYVAANTLLILVDGENSGEVFRTSVEGYQGSTFKQLAINDNMYTDYVLQVINLHRKTLRENKVGSAIPHLNKKLFKAIDVPIPPYEEQQRIVNAINEAFTTLDEIVANL